MPRIIRSAEARADVDEAARYIARDNLDAALRWLDLVDQKLKFPGAGPLREDLLAPQLHTFPIGSYVIFYRPVKGGIEAVRILHGARNLRKTFTRPKPK